jgi:hypothetical protein
MNNEFGKDVKGYRSGLILYSALLFACGNGKPLEAYVRIAGHCAGI